MTEANFETALSEVLSAVFPMFAREDIKHQTTYAIRIGHGEHTLRGGAAAWAKGRSDIVLWHKGKPLAVFELKRPDIALSDEDWQQGRSYARLLVPMAPLVIVSNSDETKVFDSFSGNELKSVDGAKLESLLKNAARVAVADLRHAIETLLGTDASVWVSAVRQLTVSHMGDLTGEWDDLLRPFPVGLLLPRKATGVVQDLLERSDKIPIVTGSPLAGKSNVLREVAMRNVDSEQFAVLFLDHGSSAHGIFQTIANLLSALFELQVSVDQVRGWLRSISRLSGGPTFVIAIDGVDAAALRAELDELVSEGFGTRLRIVIAVDEGELRRLILNNSGRHKTRIGNRAALVPVDVLDDEEFELVAAILYERRLVLTGGSHRAAEYRVPWLLRTIIARLSRDLEAKAQDVAAALHSVPSWEPLDFALRRFSGDQQLLGQYGAVAEAVLRLLDSESLPMRARALLMSCYLCDPKSLAERLGESEVSELRRGGYLKTTLLEDGSRLYVPQLPHLVAAMIALKLAHQLKVELQSNPEQAAAAFVRRCANLYNGEVIGARALLFFGQYNHELPEPLIRYLMDHPPVSCVVPPGTRAALLANGSWCEIEVGEGGKVFFVKPDGERVLLTNEEPSEGMRTHAEFTPWLILSHLANVPLAAFDADTGSYQGRVDLTILCDVGACPIILRRPEGSDPEPVLSHEIGNEVIVCHQEGIIEPITMAIHRTMLQGRLAGESLIRKAVARKSLSLLSRINIALEGFEGSADNELADWAKEVREQKVLPAFQGTLLAHDAQREST